MLSLAHTEMSVQSDLVPALLPSAIADLTAQVAQTRQITLADRYGLMAAILSDSLQEEEREAIDRLLRAVCRGRFYIVDELSAIQVAHEHVLADLCAQNPDRCTPCHPVEPSDLSDLDVALDELTTAELDPQSFVRSHLQGLHQDKMFDETLLASK